MRQLTLPPSWDKMNFYQQQLYLCDSHQAKNLCDAAKKITKRTNEKIRAAIREAMAIRRSAQPIKLWYQDA